MYDMLLVAALTSWGMSSHCSTSVRLGTSLVTVLATVNTYNVTRVKMRLHTWTVMLSSKRMMRYCPHLHTCLGWMLHCSPGWSRTTVTLLSSHSSVAASCSTMVSTAAARGAGVAGHLDGTSGGAAELQTTAV